MNVKKIFITLITIVLMVLLGAWLLNVLAPNVTKTICNASEDMIFKATGLSFDFNNDGTAGSSGGGSYQGDQGDAEGIGTDTVEGFN